MENLTARIAVRSRRQAMDWSLVLASQGVETVIEAPTNEQGWALTIRPEDAARAMDALQKYCAENRGRGWAQQRVASGVFFDWTALLWIFLLAFCYWVSTERPQFEAAGIRDNVAIAAGEWWRIFTAIMLHADLKHLAMNCSTGLVFLGLAMGLYGTGTGLLMAFLAGAGGNLLAISTSQARFGLGGSGMVLGALGLLAAQWFVVARKNPRAGRLVLAGISGGLLLFVLFGVSVSPQTDMVAHAGGFGMGLLLGSCLAFVPERLRRNPLPNLMGGIAVAAVVILCWTLALQTQGFGSSPALE